MSWNGIWGVFYLPYPLNKDKKCYLTLHHSILTLDYKKRHVNSLQKVSNTYQYVVKNLTWSGVYLRSNFSNALRQKVLKVLPIADVQ